MTSLIKIFGEIEPAVGRDTMRSWISGWESVLDNPAMGAFPLLDSTAAEPDAPAGYLSYVSIPLLDRSAIRVFPVQDHSIMGILMPDESATASFLPY